MVRQRNNGGLDFTDDFAVVVLCRRTVFFGKPARPCQGLINERGYGEPSGSNGCFQVGLCDCATTNNG